MNRPAALLLVSSLALAQTPSSDAAFGVWPWLVGNIDASVPSIIAQAQAAGTDTIYLHLFRTTGPGQGTLHMVDEAGNWNAANGPIDPDARLTTFLSQAHAANLQVVGVVNCFLETGPLPGHVAHETLLLNVIDYLVNNFGAGGNPVYALDGIALDRVRFYTGTGNPHAPVTDFVRRVKQKLGLVPLHAFLMANLYTFDGPTYNGVFNSYASAMGTLQSQFGQHWENLSEWLDVYSPMAYIADGGVYGTNSNLMRAYVQVVCQYARQAMTNAGRPGKRLLPAVRAWNDATGTTTATTLDASVAGGLLGNADGFMAFRYFTMTGQTTWWNVLAARSTAFAEWPVASLSLGTTQGLTRNLSAAGSTSLVAPSGSLTYRFDIDDDGIADTPWGSSSALPWLSPSPGSHRVAVEVRDPSGRTAVRKRRITTGASGLSVSVGSLSIAAGGTRTFSITGGPGAGGLLYVLGATASGTSPGLPLASSVLLPLNYDPLTEACLLLANSPILPGFIGLLDGNGGGQGSLVLPAGGLSPALAWTTWHFAAALADPISGEWRATTAAVPLLLLP